MKFICIVNKEIKRRRAILEKIPGAKPASHFTWIIEVPMRVGINETVQAISMVEKRLISGRIPYYKEK